MAANPYANLFQAAPTLSPSLGNAQNTQYLQGLLSQIYGQQGVTISPSQIPVSQSNGAALAARGLSGGFQGLQSLTNPSNQTYSGFSLGSGLGNAQGIRDIQQTGPNSYSISVVDPGSGGMLQVPVSVDASGRIQPVDTSKIAFQGGPSGGVVSNIASNASNLVGGTLDAVTSNPATLALTIAALAAATGGTSLAATPALIGGETAAGAGAAGSVASTSAALDAALASAGSFPTIAGATTAGTGLGAAGAGAAGAAAGAGAAGGGGALLSDLAATGAYPAEGALAAGATGGMAPVVATGSSLGSGAGTTAAGLGAAGSIIPQLVDVAGPTNLSNLTGMSNVAQKSSSLIDGISNGQLLNAGASLGSALLGSSAAQSAADTQAQAARDATQAQLAMYNQNRQDNLPYMQTGYAALDALKGGLGLTDGTGQGDLNKPYSGADMIANDPGYQFRMDQGQQALERSAAARGGLMNGGTLKALGRYGQDYASNEYQNSYNRYNTDQTNRYNRLASLANVGQTANNQVGSYSSSTANNIGNNITGAGNAVAAGQVGSANAITGAISSGVQGYMLNNILQNPQLTQAVRNNATSYGN